MQNRDQSLVVQLPAHYVAHLTFEDSVASSLLDVIMSMAHSGLVTVFAA